METKAKAAIREVKQHLAANVRNDWQWPPNASDSNANNSASHPAPDAGANNGDTPGLKDGHASEVGDLQFQDRYYGQSTQSESPSPSPVRTPDGSSKGQLSGKGNSSGTGSAKSRRQDQSPHSGTASRTADAKSEQQNSTYKFFGPDEVQTYVEGKRNYHVRRRNGRLRKEMEWNEGLRDWVARRDAWTNARSPARGKQEAKIVKKESVNDDEASPKGIVAETSSLSINETGQENSQEVTIKESSDASQMSSPELPAEQDPSLDNAQLPIAAPLISNTNPVRKAIGPDTYDEIYEKTVVLGQTPSVPINLSDMVRACVQGWKKDGVWPAQQPLGNEVRITGVNSGAAAQNPIPGLLGRMVGGSNSLKKKKKKDSGGIARTRSRRENKSILAVKSEKGEEAEGEDSKSSGGIFSNRRHFRASVEGVKKVFRLSTSSATLDVNEEDGHNGNSKEAQEK